MSKYIIIAGTNKAATTSVFQYLADHVDVCSSYIKQTNYFLDSETQKNLNLTSIYDYEANFNNYHQFFKCDTEDSKFYLEASPDYMYSETAIDRLADFYKKHTGKVILILRSPVTRFKSWFSFGKQTGLLDSEMSFNEFYEASKVYSGKTNQALMAYKTGLYSNYILQLQDKLGKDRLQVLFYEDLTENPSEFMSNLCEKTEIDNSFYSEYDFKHFNKTIKVKSRFVTNVYTFFRTTYLNYFYKGTVGVKIGLFLKSILSPLYRKLNTSKVTTAQGEEFLEVLKSDYKADKIKLEKLIGKTPW